MMPSVSTPLGGLRPSSSSFAACATRKITVSGSFCPQAARPHALLTPRATFSIALASGHHHRRRRRLGVVVARSASSSFSFSSPSSSPNVAARAAAVTAGEADGGSTAASSSSPSSSNQKDGPQISVFSAKPYVVDFLAPSLNATFPSPPPRYFTARLDASTARLAEGSDVVVVFVNDKADAATLRVLKEECGVGLVALRCAGYDCVDLKEARRLGIKVLRVPTYSPQSVAEHAVGLSLSLCRNIPQAFERAKFQNFELSGLVGIQLKGRCVGIVGTGAIGTAAISIFKGLGCKVIAYDRVVNPAARAAGAKYVESVDALLSQSDIVSLHVPLNDSTRHLINADSLKKLKRGAMLVNVSRGGLIDTPAVLDAIDSGVVGALAIDVYENEEKIFFEDLSEIEFQKRRHLVDRQLQLLMSYSNVLVTPHVAFATHEALAEIAKTVESNIAAFWDARQRVGGGGGGRPSDEMGKLENEVVWSD